MLVKKDLTFKVTINIYVFEMVDKHLSDYISYKPLNSLL